MKVKIEFDHPNLGGKGFCFYDTVRDEFLRYDGKSIWFSDEDFIKDCQESERKRALRQ